MTKSTKVTPIDKEQLEKERARLAEISREHLDRNNKEADRLAELEKIIIETSQASLGNLIYSNLFCFFAGLAAGYLLGGVF